MPRAFGKRKGKAYEATVSGPSHIPKRRTGAGGLPPAGARGAQPRRDRDRENDGKGAAGGGGSPRAYAYSLGTMRAVSDSILLFGFQFQSPSWSYRATSGVPFSERATTG